MEGTSSVRPAGPALIATGKAPAALTDQNSLMAPDPKLVQSIFLAAVEQPDADARASIVQRRAGSDAETRQRVEALLRAHDRSEGFLARPAVSATPPTAAATDEHERSLPVSSGTLIAGRYRLLDKIGEGGMGAVWIAEQQEPVRRRVALKLIKAGMDSPHVLARFEAERQTLAMMDHPGIAKVLDGGTTEEDHPYLVMELVQGIPITRYCDEHRLALRDRLSLFVQVCGAVQHAHQKGIIHRDLKPSNVLIASCDGRPLLKVIDFGIAKVTEGALAEQAGLTSFGALVGTPEYMSPEQAELNQLDVDTRSDIYSLGVLLYELLTGSTPLEHERVRKAAVLEVLRMIREEEPPRPSTRLSTTLQLREIAARRALEPRKLSGLLKGELDWIVMKALEKDRHRRYETAHGLLRDVERYLDDQPVQACPPSALYRFRKFARRHRGALLAGGAALATLLVLIGVLTVSNVLIRQEQARTRTQHKRAEEAHQLAEGRAREIAQGLEGLKAANALLDRGHWYVGERRWNDAHASFTRAIALRRDHVASWFARGELYTRLGLWDLAAADSAREVELRQPDTALGWLQHVMLRTTVGDEAGCRSACLRMREQFRGAVNPIFVLETLRAHCLTPGAFAEAAADHLMEQVQEVLATWVSRSSHALFVVGACQYRAGEYERAARQLEASLAADHNETRLLSQPVLAMVYQRLGRTEAARRKLDEADATLDRWTGLRYAASPDRWIMGMGAEGTWPVAWWDWLEMDLWCRESWLLIRSESPPADPRLLVLRARAFAGLRWPERALPEYAAAMDLEPEDLQIRLEAHRVRGYLHVYNRAWNGAAAEFAEATRLRPDDAYLWRFRALAECIAGNTAAYRETCAAMLARLGDTGDSGTACNLVYSCVLESGAIDTPARLLPLTDVAARDWHYGTWVRGAALYRAGRYAEAAGCFESAAKIFRPRTLDLCFLSMAHYRLGHVDEARRCLAEAVRWAEQADLHEHPEPADRRPAWGGWDERPVSHMLLSEARQLLRQE